MKYKIRDFRVDFRVTEQEWDRLLSKRLRGETILSCQVLRRSVDARKNILFVYHLAVELSRRLSEAEQKALNVEEYAEEEYRLPCSAEEGQRAIAGAAGRPGRTVRCFDFSGMRLLPAGFGTRGSG